MFSLTEGEIVQMVGQYFWPLARISGLFMAMPIIGTRLVSARIRILLAVFVTLLVAPLLPNLPVVDPLSISSLIIVTQQTIIGLAIGLQLQVVFHIFVLAGQFMAMKMGLGFASMNDPSNGVTVTVVSQFYVILTTLLFLSFNGHLVIFSAIVDSFTSIPISSSGLAYDAFWQIAESGGWMFSRALLIAMPVLTSLLVVNLAFGVMSRSAPQMNVFAVGFPITLVFGMLLIWYSMGSFLPNYRIFMEEGFVMMNNLLKLS